MNRNYFISGKILLLFVLFSTAFAVSGQETKETFTGTVLSFGSGTNTRTVSRQFTLTIDSQTSNESVERYLTVLKNDGQDKLIDAINDQRIGRFSVGANVGVPINVVRESVSDGKRRFFIVFERWTEFAELRYGYRSLDYPFGVIELIIDEKTGKGEGTYFAAARINWDSGRDGKASRIEVENFATFPARLMGVQRRGKDKK